MIQSINVGTSPNDGTGDTPRTAFTKANVNFTDHEDRIAAVETGQGSGTVGFSSKSAMDADLAHDAGTVAYVTNDGTEENNGIYRKTGASGTGAWVASDISFATPLPEFLSDPAQRTSGNGATEVTEYDPTLGANVRRSRFDTTPSIIDIQTTTGAVHIGGAGDIYIPWIQGAPGFAVDGTLVKVRVPASTGVSSGGKLQAWVVRPTSTIVNTGAGNTFSLVAIIGEMSLTTSGNPDYAKEFSGLSIPVQAGDMVAYRLLNANLKISTGSGKSVYVQDKAGDLSLNAINSGLSGASAAATTFDIYTEVIPGPFVADANRPGSVVRTNAQGVIPNSVIREGDSYWKGKKIIAVGTSITYGGNATNVETGFVSQARRALQANLVNSGEPSTGICSNSALGLSNTSAELIAAYGNAIYGAYSYEAKIIGQAADLVIFDHGVNDSLRTIGTIDSTDRTTIYGAFNHIISAMLADNPDCRFMFITPWSLYVTYGGTPPALQKTALQNIRTAILALGDKYASPVLDFSKLLGADKARTEAATLTADGLHPNQYTHDIMGRLLYNFIRDMA